MAAGYRPATARRARRRARGGGRSRAGGRAVRARRGALRCRTVPARGPALGEKALERRDEGVAARPVDGAGAAKVTVELAPLEEVGEGELLDDRRAQVVALLGGGDGIEE